MRTIHRNNLRLCTFDSQTTPLPVSDENSAQGRHPLEGLLLGAHPPLPDSASLAPLTWHRAPVNCNLAPTTPDSPKVVSGTSCPVNSETTIEISAPNSFASRDVDSGQIETFLNAGTNSPEPDLTQLSSGDVGNYNQDEPSVPLSSGPDPEPEERISDAAAGTSGIGAHPRRSQRSNFGLRPPCGGECWFEDLIGH